MVHRLGNVAPDGSLNVVRRLIVAVIDTRVLVCGQPIVLVDRRSVDCDHKFAYMAVDARNSHVFEHAGDIHGCQSLKR